jgi:hypothetical protein
MNRAVLAGTVLGVLIAAFTPAPPRPGSVATNVLARAVGPSSVAPQAAPRMVRGCLYRATSVRGRLACQNTISGDPVQAVRVRLAHPQLGTSSWASSGNDGMFYLYNAPPGDYTLEIEINPKDERNGTIRLAVRVAPSPITDLSPIRLS